MNESAKTLNDLAGSAPRWRGPAPVRDWNPPYCGEIDIEIRRDGSWWHEGRPLSRAGMSELFASLLLLEEGDYFLVTPVEKVRIRVEDCPFFAVELKHQPATDSCEQRLAIVTSLGEEVEINSEHPLLVGDGAEPHPVVHVRDGLRALVSRPLFYELAELAVDGSGENAGCVGIWSAGEFFPLSA